MASLGERAVFVIANLTFQPTLFFELGTSLSRPLSECTCVFRQQPSVLGIVLGFQFSLILHIEPLIE